MAEFSHIVHKREIEDGPLSLTLEADDDARRNLADRFNLLDISHMVVSVNVEKADKGGIRVSGALDADVVQACVTSLKPVDANVKQDFSVFFIPSDRIKDAEGEDAWIDAEGEEDVEPLVGDAVDVGEVAAQTLSLSLDPYPRAPGAEIASGDRTNPTEEPEEDRANPFAVLKKLTQE